jgi:hypothetical protein
MRVIAVERDVEGRRRDVMARNVLQRPGDATGERHTSTPDANERQIINRLVAFEDFVRDTREGAADPVRIHDYGHEAPLCGLTGPQLKRVR